MRGICRKLARLPLLLLAVAALFVVTAAPGGGGHGGGVGGGHAGGFSGAGGFHGGYGSGRGGGGALPPWALGLGVAAVGAVGAALVLQARSRVVEIVLHLRDGQHCVPVLDSLLMAGGFTTPEGRALALRRIGELAGDNVVDAFARLGPACPGASAAIDRAESAWRQRMRQSGIREDALGGGLASGAPRVIPGDACVLGLVVVIPAVAARNAPGSEAIDLLRKLPDLAVSALYLYYAPDPGQRLDPAQAAALFARLRAEDASAGAPQPQATSLLSS
jgi:hypothetical protein